MLHALLLLALSAPQNPPVNPPKPEQTADARTRNIPERIFQLADLQTTTVTIDGKHKFRLWVMDSFSKRQEGMMFLLNSDFKDDQGMLFVFMRAEPQRFWMKNTLVDLDIAYIGSDKTINTILTMKALDTITDYSANRPSQYVIEVRAGLFGKLGIKQGMKVDFPASIRARD
ncbi:MAG: DUF192 domain-containing protein [Fimbriimonadaceae bacterium]|jgi:hypothetical protein|nr:DUF192 domain-containing protein [Fimbriimonadaceae bacterium]